MDVMCIAHIMESNLKATIKMEVRCKNLPLLDIIVPHYKEPYEIVAPFFNVLKSQKGVNFNDFRVLLIHDGTPDFYMASNKGPLNLIERIIPHKGVSACRNYGIDHADAKWICFCDCDDSYTSIFSLMMIFHVLKDSASDNFDLIWGPFYMHNDGGLAKCMNPNSVFIHNKYYRTSFLKEYNIRFCEDLYMSEDSAFNTVVNLEMDRKRLGQINYPEPLYAWCRRPGSITMDLSKWLSNTEGHFNRNLYVLEEFRKRGCLAKDTMIARVITDVYVMLNKTEIKEDTTAFLNRVRDFYNENEETYKALPESIMKAALEASDKDMGNTPEEISKRIGLDQWVEKNIKGN